jgi:hypothetical protein
MIRLRDVPTSILDQFKASNTVRVCEILVVYWNGGGNVRYYSNAAWDKQPGWENLADWGVTGVDPRFESDSWFLDVPRTSDISDDVIKLKMWDADSAISDLYENPLNGEGTRVEVAQFFPDITDPALAPKTGWWNPIFWGLLKGIKNGDGIYFSLEASTGLRSPNLPIPRRAIYPGCQAIFGGEVNPYTGGRWFDTAAKIAENDCPYDLHIGGTVGLPDPGTGQPYTFCPRRDKNDCKVRIGDPVTTGKALPYLGFEVTIEGEFVGVPWRGWVAYTQANETALKEPIRVVYGFRVVRDIVLLAFQQQSGGSNPQNGYLKTLFVVAEGPVVGLGDGYGDGNAWSDPNNPTDHPRGPSTKRPGSSTFIVNDTQVACFDVDYSGSFGVIRQPPTDFTSVANRPQALGYSMTSVARVNVGRADWRNITADQVRGQVTVKGLKSIRRYTAPATYTRGYTTNRAWCLLDLLTSRRYGLGYDYARFEIQDWIDLAAYCDEMVSSINEAGGAVTVPRSTFNAVISSRKAGDIINDICLSGRISLPFTHAGKIRVVALDLPAPVAASVPNFTDEDAGNPYVADSLSDRNIIWDSSHSTLGYSRKSDSEVVNQIKLTYDDGAYYDAERPVVVKDDDRQLSAGKAYGDFSLRAVEKSYVGFGVASFPEAARLAQLLLYYGELDKGGTKNNMGIKFRTWSLMADAVGLHPFALIRVVSKKINRFVEVSTILSAAIDSSVTTIPVVSTIGFATSGKIFIGSEAITYSGKTGTAFTSAVRGADSTTAASHLASSAVNSGYQCEYFRIQKMRRVSNLECEIEASLYPRGFVLSTQESVPAAGQVNPGGTRSDPVKVQQIATITTEPGGGRFKIA